MRLLTGTVLLALVLLTTGVGEATKETVPIKVRLALAKTQRQPGGEIPLTFFFEPERTEAAIRVKVEVEGAVEALPLEQERWTAPTAMREYRVPLSVRTVGFGYGSVRVEAGAEHYGRAAYQHFLVTPEGVFVGDGTTSLEQQYFNTLVALGKLHAGGDLYERIKQTADGGGGQLSPDLAAGTIQEMRSYLRPYRRYEITAEGPGDVDLIVLGPDGKVLGVSTQRENGLTERVSFVSTWFGRYTVEVKAVTATTYRYTIKSAPVVIEGDTAALPLRLSTPLTVRRWLTWWPALLGGAGLLWLLRREMRKTTQ